ncbi:MAG TPA: glycosyltransferase family 39 protein [Actinocrinis sp.]|jgi:4-amino-4-deoxy-L-arabinose transferase-like glycosyltransferase
MSRIPFSTSASPDDAVDPDSAAPPEAAPAGARPDARPRRHWEFWRSPAGQPAWSRPVLLAIAALAALLYSWNIADSGYAYFYSTAVKSMSVSWKAFFYGALDPGATITIDKLAGSFLPQALSARIFGFHAWSVTLPQVIEGVISVLVVHRIARRWAGPETAVLAAGLFTLTPVLASMFGHPMEDGALTMCLVLAADAYQRAVLERRLRSLLLAGMWVGLGFQAKMMQAWIVLPALGLGYLLLATPGLRRRIGHLLLAAVVAGAVSFSWIALYTFTPAPDRPYIDGSTDNSAVSMVFGYNGFSRFGVSVNGAVDGFGSGGGGTPGAGPRGADGVGGSLQDLPGRGAEPGSAPVGGGFPGAGSFPAPGAADAGGTVPGDTVPGNTDGVGGPAGGGAPFAGRGGGAFPGAGGGGGGGPAGIGSQATGIDKLFTGRFATQIGWLYPLAFASLAFGLAGWFRRRRRADRLGSGLLMWGVWLATTMAVFSKIDIPHTAYMATLAPPLTILSAFGIVEFSRAYRRGGTLAWALPAVVAGQTIWTVHLADGYSSFLPWLTPVVICVGALAVALLAGGLIMRRAPRRAAGDQEQPSTPDRIRPHIRSRLGAVTLVAAVAAMIAMPAAWSLSALDVQYDGSAFDAGAGPSASEFGLTATATLTAQESRLLAYVDARRGSARYVMAATSWSSVAPYIEATGQELLPMGGFSGSVPQPTLAAFQQMVHAGEVKFVLVDSAGGGALGGGRGGAGTATSISTWVRDACTEISASAYGDTGTSNTSGTSGGGFQPGAAGGAGGTGTLYQCSTTAK